MYLLAWLVPHATPFRLVLRATENVTDKAFATVKIMDIDVRVLSFVDVEHETRRPREAGLNQRPAAADPMAVATVHELVCTATIPALRSILSRREPRNKSWDVEKAKLEALCEKVSFR